MVEHSILKLFVESQELYDKYYKYLRLDDYIKSNYPILSKLFKCLPSTGFSDLEAKYLTNYPIAKEGDREVLANLVKQIRENEAESASIVSYLETHKARALANEITLIAIDVSEGRKSQDDLIPYLEKLSTVSIEEEDEYEFITTDIEQLQQDEDDQPGLSWRLKCLNQSLGPLRKGNYGQIFARLETGKTAMWVSEVTHMAQQASEEHPILIFFNEEDGQAVVWRMYSALTGMTYMQLRNNVKQAKQIWDEKIGNRIKFSFGSDKVEKRYIEKAMEKFQPSLAIIDNMDKCVGFTADRKDLTLGEIHKWGRSLAQKYCPIITVGQASDSGTNTMWLSTSDMADSKTGKPAELDFILGIGKIDKDGYEDVRYLHLSKNKLRGGKDTVEAMRHMKQEVLLRPALSIYEDL